MILQEDCTFDEAHDALVKLGLSSYAALFLLGEAITSRPGYTPSYASSTDPERGIEIEVSFDHEARDRRYFYVTAERLADDGEEG